MGCNTGDGVGGYDESGVSNVILLLSTWKRKDCAISYTWRMDAEADVDEESESESENEIEIESKSKSDIESTKNEIESKEDCNMSN